jgi:3-dehydroquinate synthase
MNAPQPTSLKPLYFLYGPSGSGKSSTGRLLAEALGLPFFDLDSQIETTSGQSIPQIFAAQGEPGFRRQEAACLRELLRQARGVIALGGGALLDNQSRALVEARGPVLVLDATPESLVKRLQKQPGTRPLVGDGEDLPARITALVQRRAEHYASFSLHLNTSSISPAEAAWQAQITLGAFYIRGMGAGYDVRVASGGLDKLGELFMRADWGGPVVVVSDDHVGPLYAGRAVRALAASGYNARSIIIPSGEAHKTLENAAKLWDAFLEAGVERGSTIVALGGGVVSDLTGFAASTYLRGVRWVVVPTSLLSMVDASLGGKTGIDLPQGKNLAGSFYPPALVLSDPDLLASLPLVELRNGLAEALKQGILGDPGLFEQLSQLDPEQPGLDWGAIVRRAVAVKVSVIQADPYEKGQRAALNLGHTIGHALEKGSNFQLRHGEAVAAGMVVEAKLAEALGLAQPGLAQTIQNAVRQLGLPEYVPDGLKPDTIFAYMSTDKKRANGKVRFALPLEIGQVQTGVAIESSLIQSVLEESYAPHLSPARP